jgi:hypothetical protein
VRDRLQDDVTRVEKRVAGQDDPIDPIGDAGGQRPQIIDVPGNRDIRAVERRCRSVDRRDEEIGARKVDSDRAKSDGLLASCSSS